MEKTKPFRATTFDSTSFEKEKIDIDFYSLAEFQDWLHTAKEGLIANPSLLTIDLLRLEEKALAHFR